MAVNGSLPRIVGADVEKESGAEEGGVEQAYLGIGPRRQAGGSVPELTERKYPA